MLRYALLPAVLAFTAVVAAPSKAQEVIRYDSELGSVTVREIAGGLEHPWSLAFLPGGEHMLVTERPGRLRIAGLNGSVSEPIEGVPQVYAQGQGGLLDVHLSPDFARDRLVYLSYAEAGEGGRSGTAVGRGRLTDDMTRLEDFRVIFRQTPKLSAGLHYGSRMDFDREGYLFIALGENNQRPAAQELDKHQGKVVRLYSDGEVPDDNPFVGQADVRPEIWSYGHRNPQGAALNPWTSRLWLNEHGPRGGDEINIPHGAKNYGWPLATHGVNYSMQPIPEAKGKTVDGTEPAHYVWEVSPGVSGMAFYDANRFPTWQRSLFIGALVDQSLIRLQLDGDKVVGEERLLKGMGARIRDVRLGPDGYLYLLTDESKGRLLQVGLESR